MAEDRRQGQRCGTASQKPGRHQKALERPTGEGPERQHTGQEGPDMSIPPPEQAPSEDSSSVDLEPDDQPGPSGTSGQSVPHTQTQATADLTPSGNISTAPTQRAHASVSRTGQSAVCPPLQGTQADPTPQQQQGPGGSGSGHTVQGTEARGNRATGRAAVRQGGGGQAQGTDSPRGPHHHHGSIPPLPGDDGDGTGQVQEIQAQQEERYMGYREELRNIVLALNLIVTTLRDHVAPQRAPVTSPDQEQPTTSAGASGQEAPTQRRATRTPPPAEDQPPRKRNLRSQRKTE
ncbi:hypothetical protein NDU88_007109 [Pleurodeles waltl]|uniref:Uncharacterized protein n=1 Tax=Pleurodeles waltl TaxID=8319 RepID=A0AAV7UP66_PLEWA|nr:hypothetical protein NDU88_007109 [Pleurodeles waltl]